MLDIIALGAVGANTAPALSYDLVGNGSRCRQIDIILWAENHKGGIPGCFGNTEEGTSSEGGDWVSGMVSWRRPLLRKSGSYRMNRGRLHRRELGTRGTLEVCPREKQRQA